MIMRIITITRQVGSWGDYIGVSLADALKWRYIDREIIAEASERAGITEKSLQKMETQTGLFRGLINTLSAMPSVPAVPSQALRFSELHSLVSQDERVHSLIKEGFNQSEAFRHVLALKFPEVRKKYDYASLVRSVVNEFADAGKVVIAGSGAQMILKDRHDVFHALIIAPEENRVRAIMEQEEVSRKVAERRIKENDLTRTTYFRRYFKVNWLDPNLYDLVINTGKVTKELAKDLIKKASSTL
jgi:CMP/dCMP kinase